MYDCDAEDSLELSFKKDEILYNGMHVLQNVVHSIHPSFSFPFLPHFIPLSLPSLVTESEEPDWLKAARADGRRGLVPANYLEMLP